MQYLVTMTTQVPADVSEATQTPRETRGRGAARRHGQFLCRFFLTNSFGPKQTGAPCDTAFTGHA